MSEKTVYENISPNSVFSVYSGIESTSTLEVMGYNDHYWYIDNGYREAREAIDALISGDGWSSDGFEQDGIGELKFTFTIESHPEFFI